MKKYNELTQVEKEELTEKDIEKLINYELMELGIAPEPNTEKPTFPPHVKQKKFYQVGSYIFETTKKAEAMIALQPLIETYDYSIGYNVKFAKQRHTDNLKIAVIELPTEESVMENRERLTEYDSEYEEWERRQNKNTEYDRNRTKVVREIRTDFEKIQQIKMDRETITKTFEEYKTLAINEEAALKFLMKTFSADRIRAIGMEVPDEE